jgi:hypothetical protein
MSVEDDSGLVLAIDAGTYLTLALRPGDGSEFHESFAAALDNALGDLGVPEKRIAVECEAVRGLPLAKLTDATLREALTTIDFICGTELEYHRDLRIVQWNLNRFPHELPPYYVSATAVECLFGLALPASPAPSSSAEKRDVIRGNDDDLRFRDLISL